MEVNKTKKPKKSNILRFYPYTKGFRTFYLLSLATLVVSVIAGYMTPQIIRIIVDSVIGEEPFQMPGFVIGWVENIGGREALRQNIIICAAATLVFALISGICTFTYRMSLAKASEGTVQNIRDILYAHIQRLPFKWHNEHQTGDIIQRCTQDVNLIRNFINGQLTEIIRTVLLLVVSLVLMFSMNVKLALVVLCFLPVLTASSLVFFILTGKRFQKADEAEGELTSVAQENFTGVRVVRAFGREKYEIDKFIEKSENFAALWRKLGRLMSLNWGFGDLLAGLQVLVVTVAGVFFVKDGNLTAGEFLAFISYNSMIVWPARNLGRVLSELSKTRISSTRIFEILDAEEEKDSPNAKEPEMNRDIAFENVSFRYDGSSSGLEDVSFNIKAGSTFGILGATGSGKSTLIYLLDRLYDLPEGCGKITIGGENIQEIKLSHLRKNIGVVLQEPFLFSKTFRENISDAAVTDDLQTVKKYSKLAVIDDSIESFSQGYETPIGERGVTISGGQKQRIAIARMLMQDTPIKIFDDSLSAVDMETDAKIRKSINQKVEGTTILIAHRISTIMNADKILVLDKGRVSQIGTHAELIKTDGIYKRIYEAQKAVTE